MTAHWALGKSAVLEESIIQHQCASYRQVEGEAGGDAYDVAAASQHLRRQAGPLRTEHVGCIQRMAKRWQVGGVVQQLHADQHTTFWKAERIEIGEAPERDVSGGIGRIGQAPRARIEAGTDHEAERGAEGVRGAQECADVGRFRDTFDANAEIAA